METPPKIQTWSEKRVVGIGTRMVSILSSENQDHELIPHLWGGFHQRLGEIPGRVGETLYGYCEDPPGKGREKEIYYVACVEVPPGTAVPAGMIERPIPGGRYAVFTHRGGLESLRETFGYAYNIWFPESNEKIRAGAPHLEVYDARFQPGKESSEMDICIPLEEASLDIRKIAQG
jgi:AraC family transcriptional regulator